MNIHCRRIGCTAVITVECSIEGFSMTERGIEPDGHFTLPPAPWRPHALGGYVCCDDCARLESFSMGSQGR